jgi:hypothetical protein
MYNNLTFSISSLVCFVYREVRLDLRASGWMRIGMRSPLYVPQCNFLSVRYICKKHCTVVIGVFRSVEKPVQILSIVGNAVPPP